MTAIARIANATLKSGWGYDHQRYGVSGFDRAKSDTRVALAPHEYAKPGNIIAYLPDGLRVHVTLRAIIKDEVLS